jgi:indole-3-glycerol phosphate synthase
MGATEQPARWLERMVRAKQQELEAARRQTPQSVLESRVERRPPGRFRRALELRPEGKSDCAVIAELKHASPSKGIICEDYDPAAIGRSYAQAGAKALSVLTDKEFFHGSLDDLRQAKASAGLPILRKDFTLDEYHLYEAAAAGADAVLLIVAILPLKRLSELLRLSSDLGLDALVEVHTGEELRIALDAEAEIIGVNNRDLGTFEVTLATSFELIDLIPDKLLAVSESGLRTGEDLRRLRAAGFDAFLIGERFMAERDPGAALERLLSEVVARPVAR